MTMSATAATRGLLSLGTALCAMAMAGTAVAQNVTGARLLNPEPQNWLQIHRTYDSNRFSPLDQINKTNVKNMKIAFTTAIGGLPGGGNYATGSLQATPLVDDGAMFVVDGWGSVYKIDVKSGKAGRIQWVMNPGVDKADVWIPANRGVSLAGDQVISVTGNGHVISSSAKTGEQKWDKLIDSVRGFSLTTPPIVVGDKLIVGGSGGDRGVRDHITAVKVSDGTQIWRTYSIPAPGEPGHETWKDANNAWATGGAAFWMTGAYDPATNTTLWGTGNPVPMYDPEYRPGDNLYTNSTMALDVDSGKLKWYFQYTPNDYLDYDEIGVHLLYDATVDGQPRKVLGHFGRNGYYYNLDRNTGQFLNAVQYVEKVTWTKGIDPKTGKPVEYDATKALQTYAPGALTRRGKATPGLACPHIQGGVNYFPTSYSAKSKLAYGAGIEGCSNVTTDQKRSGGAVAWNGGGAVDADRLKGNLAAIEVSTAKRKALVILPYPVYSGVLSTAGGLVITSQMDGTIGAYDDETLAELWSVNVGSGVNAPPMSYAVNGKQYIAVLVGMGTISKGRLGKSPEMADLQTASMLYVFSL